MRLLVVVSMYPHPGHPYSGIFNRNCVEAAQRQGHELVVLAPRPWVPPFLKFHPRWQAYSQIPRFSNQGGIEVHRPDLVQVPRFATTFQRNQGAFLQMRSVAKKLHRENNFDVVFSFDLGGAGGLAWRLGNYLDVPSTGWAFGLDVRIPADSTDADELRQMLNRLDLVFYQSSELRDCAESYLRGDSLDRDRHLLLPHGIPHLDVPDDDLRAAKRKELGVADDQILALFLSRVVKGKGVDELLVAFEHAAKQNPNLVCIAVGETPGFQQLDMQGNQRPDDLQELHSTTRLVHCYALAEMIGLAGAGKMVEQGLAYLRDFHHDKVHGGYVWGLRGDQVADPRKLAYGHVFVLLAASTAKMAGHAAADPLLSDVADVLTERFWEEEAGLFADEWSRDWSPFSTYRGMNANMHGVEALLAAYEATGQELFLHHAGRILDRFTVQIAPQEGWRLPEHYTENWQIDGAYSGDPMFRPAGTTPGHSLELGRLLLHHWDLTDRRDATAPKRARALIEQALTDAWMVGAKAEGYSLEGGLAYTLNFDGSIAMANRFWWPVTEAIGALATLIKLERRDEDEHWYRRLWQFASARFVDHENGGWIPEIDPSGKPIEYGVARFAADRVQLLA